LKLSQLPIAFGKDEAGVPLTSLGKRLGLVQPRRGAVAVFGGMDAQELRRLAAHYKRVASLVSDQAIAEAMLELASHCEAMADSLHTTPPERQE
jgi:hypothetical protein